MEANGKRLAVVVAFAIVAGGLGANWLGQSLRRTPEPTVLQEAIEVTIPEGLSARKIAQLLADQDVVASATRFEVEANRLGVADDLKAGIYVFQAGASVADVIAILAEGPARQATYRITVTEGKWIEEILEQLSEKSPHSVDSYRQALVDGNVTSSLLSQPATKMTDWEGLLFPDTYEFFDQATPAQILQKLATEMEKKVDGVNWEKAEALGLTRYQAITIASLIESEAKLNEDRPLISSVIYNRILDDQGLYIDATIIYALQRRGITLTDLDKEFDSPYNTYKWKGLPPGPIGAPGLASLEAAANPASTGFFYYVLCTPEGRHCFCDTLECHNQKVQEARDAGIF